ncbi:serine/threonine-protein kinase [Amycolatopsis taiwanensis]|uniref:serine/threonine-protein kinase n=1 Tax=Amycolatopsis taiwanensis TaxID=342230 RepID=UPI000A03DDF5|nr:serine/threonine-protein kinase [Amycolatopsis taiwanensis]
MTRYRFVEHLTTEGQGELWRVQETESQKLFIAKKLLLTGNSTVDAEYISRFEREVRTQSRLIHSGIMPVIGFNFTVRPPWYVMPVAQYSLDRRVREIGKFEESVAVEVMLSVMDAIEYAHSEGILHRDLKPANVLFLQSDPFSLGQWVVADFGLCLDKYSQSTTITRTRTGLGSIAYTAPEQFKDAHRIGETADVFALGKIFYFCLTGDDPFPNLDLMTIPERFRYIIDKATDNDRSRRFYSVSSMKAELNSLVSGVDADPFRNVKFSCEQYILNIKSGVHSDDASKLYADLLANSSDEHLLLELMSLFNSRVFQAVKERNASDSVDKLVYLFDDVTEGNFPFSFCDVIADFFVAAYPHLRDLKAKSTCVRKLLVLGNSHNRFYVRDALMRLLSELTGADVAAAVDVMAENVSCIPFLAGSAVPVSLPPAVRNTINAYK